MGPTQVVRQVSEEEFARDPQSVIHAVRGGVTTLIERDGEPGAALLDITDYRLLRAAAYAQTHPPPEAHLEQGLPDELLAQAADEQERFNLVVAYHVAGAISTGRAAELLQLPWIDLRERCARLNIPFRAGPPALDDVLDEVRVAKSLG